MGLGWWTFWLKFFLFFVLFWCLLISVSGLICLLFSGFCLSYKVVVRVFLPISTCCIMW